MASNMGPPSDSTSLEANMAQPPPAGESGTSAASEHPSTHPASQPALARAGSPIKMRSSTMGATEKPRVAAHARAASMNPILASQTRSNRLSLTFPIQPQEGHAATPITPLEPSPLADVAAPTSEPASDSSGPADTNFLTAIAAQERKVLELKEELLRAEAELNGLKRQWARHEAAKKRDDVRRMTKLQTLPASPRAPESGDDEDGTNAWMLQEMERRKAMLKHGRSSSRRVFSGSRHTRTLSLLSPDMPSASLGHSLPPRKDSLAMPDAHGSGHPLRQKKLSIPRSHTAPDLDSFDPHLTGPADGNPDLSIDREQIIRTGKKMASDLRNGLWTFFEDLRQATVGDEAAQIEGGISKRPDSTQVQKAARKQNSRGSLRPSSRGSSRAKIIVRPKGASPQGKTEQTTRRTSPVGLPDLTDPSFWSEHGIVATPTATPVITKKSSFKRQKPSRPSSTASSEAWDAWGDSPIQHRSSDAGSDSNTLPSTVSDIASPRLSSESTKKEPIPWPLLSKIGPSTLRRTASHLMSEWEKSLTPSPGEEYTGEEEYICSPIDSHSMSTKGTNSIDRKQE